MSQVFLCTCCALRTSGSTKPYTPCTDSCCHCCRPKPWLSAELQAQAHLTVTVRRPAGKLEAIVMGTVQSVRGWLSHCEGGGRAAVPFICPSPNTPAVMPWVMRTVQLYTSGIFLTWTVCQTAETIIPTGCQSVSLKLLGDVQACPMACRLHDCDARRIWGTAKEGRIVRLGVVQGKSHSCHSDASKMCQNLVCYKNKHK